MAISKEDLKNERKAYNDKLKEHALINEIRITKLNHEIANLEKEILLENSKAKDKNKLQQHWADLQLKKSELNLLTKYNLANKSKSGLSNIINDLVALFMQFNKKKSLSEDQDKIFEVNTLNPKDTINNITKKVVEAGIEGKKITSSDLENTDKYRDKVLEGIPMELSTINSSNFRTIFIKLFNSSTANAYINNKVKDVINYNYNNYQNSHKKIKELTPLKVTENIMKDTTIHKNHKIQAITQAITMLYVNKKLIHYKEATDENKKKTEYKFITKTQIDSIMKKAKNTAKLYIGTQEHIVKLMSCNNNGNNTKNDIQKLSACIAAASIKIEAVKNVSISEKDKKTRDKIMRKFSEKILHITEDFKKLKLGDNEPTEKNKKGQYDKLILQAKVAQDEINQLADKADRLYRNSRLEYNEKNNHKVKLLEIKKKASQVSNFNQIKTQGKILLNILDGEDKIKFTKIFEDQSISFPEKKAQLLYYVEKLINNQEQLMKDKKNVFMPQ